MKVQFIAEGITAKMLMENKKSVVKAFNHHRTTYLSVLNDIKASACEKDNNLYNFIVTNFDVLSVAANDLKALMTEKQLENAAKRAIKTGDYWNVGLLTGLLVKMLKESITISKITPEIAKDRYTKAMREAQMMENLMKVA